MRNEAHGDLDFGDPEIWSRLRRSYGSAADAQHDLEALFSADKEARKGARYTASV